MIEDSINYKEEFEKLSSRLNLLQNRFLAVAMDYKHYIKDEINDDEIYKLRDNVQYRLYSARFHFKLLLEHHNRVHQRAKELYLKDPFFILNSSMEKMYFQMQATKEAYSLFDSIIYHLCSIYDYLFRLINFVHGKTIAKNPKWNLFKNDKNLKFFEMCSKEIIPKLEEIDNTFVYPLIKHRSHLIHTANDVGTFNIKSSLGKDDFKIVFNVTELFISHFPTIIENENNKDISIKRACLWLIDQTIKTTTEILFELRDDMKRNKKQEHGMTVSIGKDFSIQPISNSYWGERNIT